MSPVRGARRAGALALAAEARAGRLDPAVDPRASALLLLGACQMTTFLAAFGDTDERATAPSRRGPPCAGCSPAERPLRSARFPAPCAAAAIFSAS
ncbi:hypothetical protein ACFPK1_06235 [Actinomycetospora rhizophila]|uniref:Uncharacterized protein n=1 Tax=Actinomycetospora rhizophila TaxID=1416876 RepID=A0ABV9ZBC1_9PSEU